MQRYPYLNKQSPLTHDCHQVVYEPGQEEPSPVELDRDDHKTVDHKSADGDDHQDDVDDRLKGQPVLESSNLFLPQA